MIGKSFCDNPKENIFKNKRNQREINKIYIPVLDSVYHWLRHLHKWKENYNGFKD